MIVGLNHAVLWVRDAERSAAFYSAVLGFEVVSSMGSRALFLRAPKSKNDHDLGLFTLGDTTEPPRLAIGLYHLAWQVSTIRELAEMHDRLLEHGALVGSSDHGVSKSLYGQDIDGIEFEVMWAVPRELWPSGPYSQPLDLEAELRLHRGAGTAHV